MKSAIGQYNVLERLGSGALGDVFRARDTRAGRTVALMVAPAELVASSARRARFLDDARRASTLNHPNIAMLFDVLEDEDGCYLAYEFAAGPSLREEMAAGALDVRQALRLAVHVTDALREGHGKGIVHGGLRPDTIVVTPKGSVKVLNFGMTNWTPGGAARAEPPAAPDALTGDEGQAAPYLSPEQALGAAADPRSDLFALGAILYEMLTGRPAFTGDTPEATVLNVTGQTPPRASVVNPALPPPIDAVVEKLLAKDPAARYESASAVAAELRRVATQLDAHAHPPEGPPAPGRKRGLIAGIALAGLIAVTAAWCSLAP